jgi:hypothetical protein
MTTAGYDCPSCGRHMEAGFVTAGKGLRWRSDGRMHLTVFGGEPVISMWRSRGTPAARCSSCSLVLVEAGGN